MSEPKFDKVPSGIKGVEAYKPNEAMQIEIAKDFERAGLLDKPGFEKWKALLDK